MENNRGFLRIVTGFLVAFGAVGGMEHNPEAGLALQVALAFGGLAVMWWGAEAARENQS